MRLHYEPQRTKGISGAFRPAAVYFSKKKTIKSVCLPWSLISAKAHRNKHTHTYVYIYIYIYIYILDQSQLILNTERELTLAKQFHFTTTNRLKIRVAKFKYIIMYFLYIYIWTPVLRRSPDVVFTSFIQHFICYETYHITNMDKWK
jgi:hypothetical protein